MASESISPPSRQLPSQLELAATDWRTQLLALNARQWSRAERLQGLLLLRGIVGECLSTMQEQGDEQHRVDSAAIDKLSIQQLIDLCYSLGDWVALLHLSDWVLARPKVGINDQHEDQHRHYQQLRLDSLTRLGLWPRAQQMATRLMFCQPHNETLFKQYQFLRELGCRDFIAQDCGESSSADDDLYLTRLDEQHLWDFYWQYGERVAELCNLPPFASDQDWLEWLCHCRDVEGQWQFAVMHRDWGFIGSVCLQLVGGQGFFYYWLGEDFQAQGFGPRAVELLLKFGRRHGMQGCFAKVYEDNLPSQKALHKLGFTALPFAVLPPFDNELLYYWGSEKEEAALYQNLRRLLFDINSDIQPMPSRRAWSPGVG